MRTTTAAQTQAQILTSNSVAQELLAPDAAEIIKPKKIS
jgi:hypothetical protein